MEWERRWAFHLPSTISRSEQVIFINNSILSQSYCLDIWGLLNEMVGFKYFRRQAFKFRASAFKTRGQSLWSNTMPFDLKYCIWPVIRKDDLPEAAVWEENASLRLFMVNNTTNNIALTLQTAPCVFLIAVNWNVQIPGAHQWDLPFLPLSGQIYRLWALLDLYNKIYLPPLTFSSQ